MLFVCLSSMCLSSCLLRQFVRVIFVCSCLSMLFVCYVLCLYFVKNSEFLGLPGFTPISQFLLASQSTWKSLGEDEDEKKMKKMKERERYIYIDIYREIRKKDE